MLNDTARWYREGEQVVIEIEATSPIVARVGSSGTTTKYLRQQSQGFMVTAFTPTPASRDAVCSRIDLVIAELRWLALSDQQARIVWTGTQYEDGPSRAALWRRSLTYNVTFWTTSLREDAAMLFGNVLTELNI